MYSAKLTKEILSNVYGITDVKEDGSVYKGEKMIPVYTVQKKGKYKIQKPYNTIVLYNKDTKKQKVFTLHRVVYAWYYNEVPEGMDVDHIDNNTLNNNLCNLQLLDRKNNNNKKKYSRNQYTYNLSDEEIAIKRSSRKYIYDRNYGKMIKNIR